MTPHDSRESEDDFGDGDGKPHHEDSPLPITSAEKVELALRERIKVLEGEAAEARVLREQVVEARQEVVTSRRMVEKLTKSIDSLEYLIRRRNSGLRTIELGSQVMICEGRKGTVSGISIDRGGVKYWVVWWTLQGTRCEELLDGTEVEKIDEDILPPTHEAKT